MKCPKCNTDNVHIDYVYNKKTSGKIVLYWALCFVVIQCYPLLLSQWKYFTYWKIQSQRKKMLICQNCSNKKAIFDTNSLLNNILIWLLIYIFLNFVAFNLPTILKNNKVILETNQTTQDSNKFDSNYQTFKEQGIQAIKADNLTEGIDLIKKAIEIKNEDDLLEILYEAYYERAEYFYSKGQFALAMKDLEEIKEKDLKTIRLIVKIKELLK